MPGAIIESEKKVENAISIKQIMLAILEVSIRNSSLHFPQKYPCGLIGKMLVLEARFGRFKTERMHHGPHPYLLSRLLLWQGTSLGFYTNQVDVQAIASQD